jgi:VanZ family protein
MVDAPVSNLSPTRGDRSWVAWWLPVVAYMAMLFGFSSVSTLPPLPGDLSNYHAHFAAYGGLAALTVRALARGSLRNVTWQVVCAAVAVASVYGVTDEYHQLFVPGRTFDVMDIAADAIGSIVSATGLGAWGIIRRRFETRDVL